MLIQYIVTVTEGGRLSQVREADLVELLCEPVEDMFEYTSRRERLVALAQGEQ